MARDLRYNCNNKIIIVGCCYIMMGLVDKMGTKVNFVAIPTAALTAWSDYLDFKGQMRLTQLTRYQPNENVTAGYCLLHALVTSPSTHY